MNKSWISELVLKIIKFLFTDGSHGLSQIIFQRRRITLESL